MGNPGVTREQAQEAFDAYLANDRNKTRAAASLNNMHRSTFENRLNAAGRYGIALGEKPAIPGFRISQITSDANGTPTSIQQKPELGEARPLPDGHLVKGVSRLQNGDGEILLEWIKTKEGELDPLHIAESLKAAFVDYTPAAEPAPAPVTSAALLTLLPANDWHIGMFGWDKQVGINWDLKIAEATIGAAMEDTVARSPHSAECIVLGGGDLLHADNKRNETTGGTPQDVDGRYEKVIDVATRLMARTVDAALRQHAHVTVRILKGNHDEHASVAVSYFLKAWYRNEPRVVVDVDPSDYFWHRFGAVLLGATHGHQSSNHIAKMPGIMAHRRPEDWGATKFRYVHGFHLHHSAKVATEGNGVVCEIHQAPIPQDAWHFGSGFLSGRSLQAITYHRDFGEIGRVRTAILDGKSDAA